jgi:hypothetical protein
MARILFARDAISRVRLNGLSKMHVENLFGFRAIDVVSFEHFNHAVFQFELVFRIHHAKRRQE